MAPASILYVIQTYHNAMMEMLMKQMDVLLFVLFRQDIFAFLRFQGHRFVLLFVETALKTPYLSNVTMGERLMEMAARVIARLRVAILVSVLITKRVPLFAETV